MGDGEAGFAGELAFIVRGGTAFFAVHVDEWSFREKWERSAGGSFLALKIAGGEGGLERKGGVWGREKARKWLGGLELKIFWGLVRKL